MFDRNAIRSFVMGRAVGGAMGLVVTLAAACGGGDSGGNDQVYAAGTSSSAAGNSGGGAAGAGGAGASKCQSYTKPVDGQCGGWYCEENEASLTAKVDATAKCGGDNALLCSNAVVVKVGLCARMIKSAMFAATNEELRPMIQECVYEDAAIKAAVPPDCLNCTIDAAACASDNCLTACLTGDSVTCDSCRVQNNCDQAVFACGGVPSPF